MAKYANQWTIRIDKPEKIEGKFVVLSREAIAEATTRLNKDALILWLYLMSQQSGIKWDISKKAIENEFGLPCKSYYRARDELIDKGFMDDYGVYMFPKMSTTQNGDNDIPIMRKDSIHDEYSNNTNNNNNNKDNNFVIIDDDKVLKPEELAEQSGFIF